MKKSKKRYPLLYIIALGAAVLVFLTALARLDSGRRLEGRQQLEDAVRRAAVACYAAEGAYPPDVDHLCAGYGIQYDRDEYTVIYNAFASNLMPEITVVENGHEK